MSTSADPSPPALDYATPSTDQPILFNRTENGATVVIRDPARQARAISEAMSEAGGMIFAGMLMGGCLFFGRFGVAKTLAGIATILALVAIGAWVRYRQFAEPIIIELKEKELIFHNLDTKRIPKIPRDRIYALKYVAHSQNLVVRASGCEMFEHQFSLPAAKVEEIAAFLRLVLKLKSEGEAANE